MKVSRSIHKEGHWPIFSGKLGKILILILRWFPIPQAGLKLTVQQKKIGLCSQVMRIQYTLGHKDQNASPQSWVVFLFFCLFVRFFLRQGYWTVAQASIELCKISCPSIQKHKSTGINNYTLKSNYIWRTNIIILTNSLFLIKTERGFVKFFPKKQNSTGWYLYMFVYVCSCVCRPEADTICLSQLLSTSPPPLNLTCKKF